MRLIDADEFINSLGRERYDIVTAYGNDGFTFHTILRALMNCRVYGEGENENDERK